MTSSLVLCIVYRMEIDSTFIKITKGFHKKETIIFKNGGELSLKQGANHLEKMGRIVSMGELSRNRCFDPSDVLTYGYYYQAVHSTQVINIHEKIGRHRFSLVFPCNILLNRSMNNNEIL